MPVDVVGTLNRFIEKADRLHDLSFFAKARGVGARVEFDRAVGWAHKFHGPDDEATEALVLTVRFFMQDNEAISLRNIRGLYEREESLRPFFKRVQSACHELNEFLDDPTGLSIVDKKFLTYRDILEIFIYGTYAHMNALRREQFEGIRTTPFFSLFRLHLVFGLEQLARAVWSVRDISVEVLGERASNSAV